MPHFCIFIYFLPYVCLPDTCNRYKYFRAELHTLLGQSTNQVLVVMVLYKLKIRCFWCNCICVYCFFLLYIFSSFSDLCFYHQILSLDFVIWAMYYVFDLFIYVCIFSEFLWKYAYITFLKC